MSHYKDIEKTEWTLLFQSPPTLPGIYNVSYRVCGNRGRFWSYWDGQKFHQISHDPLRALAYYHDNGYVLKNIHSLIWRGATSHHPYR